MATKKEKKQQARDLIKKYRFNEYMLEPDRERLSKLCGYEFQWVKRVQAKNPNSPAVEVQCDDEGWIGVWSWVKSIDGYNPERGVLQAMRSASRLGTFGHVVLDKCNKCNSVENLSVDHRTIPFAKIVLQYRNQYGSPEVEHSGGEWRLLELHKFLEFHDSLADYQVLCRACNSSKGAR